MVAKTLWWWAIGPLGAPIDHAADLVDFPKISDLTRFFRIMWSAPIAPENDLVAHYDAFGRSAEQIFDKLIQHKVTGSELLVEVMQMPKVTVYTHTVLSEAQIS